MGGGQGKVADGHAHIEACDHSPIFACFDKLGDAAEAASCKEEVAGFFTRKTVKEGASIFAKGGVGRRDLLIVERGGLRMVSCHGEKGKKELLARPVIKTVGENEMMGMMELVREVETDIDPATGDYPTDVVAESKCQLLVKLFKQLGPSNLEMLSEVAHFRSLAVGNEVLKQGETVTRLQVVLSGSLDVMCESQDPGAAPGTQIVVGHLGAGDFFGESSILGREDEHHGANHLASTASLRTTSESLFIYFHADEMRKVFLEVPEILESIDKFVKDRLTGQLLAMHLSLFDSMNQASIALFTSALTVQSYHEGDVVFEKDSHGIDFYVLVQGAVSIDDGEDVHVTLDHKGAYFGEVALLRAEPRAATVAAKGNTTIACIPGETFRTLCLTSPSVAAEFEIKALGAKASIGALLTHPRTAPLLKKTLDDEFASENYRFWLDAEDYKSNHAMGGDPKDLWAQVDKIYATYVTTTTDEQINLSGKATKILKKYFDEAAKPGGRDAPPARDVFDGSEKCVNNNLKGNVQRFCKTQGYVDFIAELAVYTPRKDQKR
ncbi:cAMP-dependent protein kinase regulator [Aureococcus anophagefferens]|nr:cAMP-dependent protein kinase regulator [Aureococcus anophagefferens]